MILRCGIISNANCLRFSPFHKLGHSHVIKGIQARATRTFAPVYYMTGIKGTHALTAIKGTHAHAQ